MTNKELKTAVLAFVNKIRKENSLPRLRQLPKGTSSATACPVALAIKGRSYFTYGFADCNPDKFLDWPDFVRSFIRNFDDKKFPELIRKRPRL